MSRVSLPSLKRITAAAGAAALLILIAVFLAEGGFGYPASSLSAAVVCSASPCSATTTDLTLTAADGTVAAGASTTLSWSANNLAEATPSLFCFGNTATSPCGNTFQVLSGLAESDRGWEPFFVGGVSYFAIGNYDNTDPAQIFQWISNAASESSVEPNNAGGAGYTALDRSWQVDNGKTVTHIGVYSASAQTMTVKIARLVTPGTYDFVMWQSCAHPGGGWYDCDVADYAVPSSGTFYAGHYGPADRGYNTGAYPRSYKAGDSAGNGQTGFSEDGGSAQTMRVKYSTGTGVACMGNGTYCGTPLQKFPPGIYSRGGFKSFSIGSDLYLAAAGSGETSKIYKWIANAASETSVVPNGFNNMAALTIIDRSWSVDNSKTVTHIGAHALTSGTMTFKIVKRNSAGNYDIVRTQNCDHPGGGWFDCDVTDYTVPASGEYYAGVYTPVNNLSYNSGSYARSYKSGNIIGNGQTGFTENGSGAPSVRVRYSNGVGLGCAGDGVYCGLPFQDFATGASNAIGGLTHFSAGGEEYVVVGNGGDTQKIYRWISPNISRTLGTNIGTLTQRGGLAGAFDGNTNQGYAGTAGGGPGDQYVGKAYSIGKAISRAVVYGSNNLGYGHSGTPSVTLNLYGKNGAPTGPHDGTKLGLITFLETDNESVGRTIISADNTTTYTHVWVTVQSAAPSDHFIGELVLYEVNATPCFGNDNAAGCGSPLQTMPSTSGHGGWENFEIGGKDYLALAGYGDTSKIYEWFGSRNATLVNGVVWHTSGVPGLGRSLYFDGVNDYAVVSNFPSVSSGITISAWVNLPAPATNQKILGRTSSSPTKGYIFGVINGQIYVEMYDTASTGKQIVAGSIPANTWTHLATTYEAGGRMKAYVNGTQVGDIAAGLDIGPAFSDLIIGSAPWSPGAGFNTTGYIDEARIYNRALSASEISTLSTKGPIEGGLLGGWSFDEVSGVTVIGRGDTGPGCAGDGTTCGTLRQDFTAGHATYNYGGWTYYVINGVQYLLATNYSGDVAKAFRWMSGSNCFGNGSVCGDPLQTFDNLSASQKKSDYFVLGDESYLAFSNENSSFPSRVFKWSPSGSGCPSGGGWGDGTSCSVGSTYQLFSGLWARGGFQHFKVGSENYLASAGYGQSSNIYKLNLVTCFGNGSVCNAVLQNPTQAGVDDWSTPFTIGADTIVVAADTSQNLVRFYKVMPDCLGNGTTCATASGSNSLQDITVNGAVFATGFTASQGTFVSVSASGVTNIYKWMPPPANGGKGCFGNSSTCGTAYQTLDSNLQEGQFFTVGSNLYLVHGWMTEPASGQIRLWKWGSGSGCPAGGGFGNGSSCTGPRYTNDVGNADDPWKIDVFTSGGSTYVWTINLDEGNSGNIIFKWVSAQECFGDGTSCGPKYNSWTPGNEHARDLITYTINGVLYGLSTTQGTNNSDGGAAQWMSGSNCFGNGTTCGQYYDASIGRAYALAYFPSGTDHYLVHTWADGTRLFKWTASGTNCPATGSWGDGTTCNNQACGLEECWTHPFQTFLTGNSIATETFTQGNASYVVTDDDIYKLSSGTASACRLYKWDGTNGTTTAAYLDSSAGFDTGILTQTTTFTLECEKSNSSTESAALTIPVGSTVTVTATDGAAAETGGTGTYNISRGASPASALAVNYTMSGTATNGSDYNTLSGTATIASGQSSTTITLTPINDASYEGSQTAILTLAASAGYTVGTPNNATVTITDNETINQVPTLTPQMIVPIPSPVRDNTTVQVTWNVTGLILENTCTLTSNPNVFSQSYAGGSTSWAGTTTSATITSQTRFTLSCLAADGTTAVSTQRVLNIIPTVQEI